MSVMISQILQVGIHCNVQVVSCLYTFIYIACSLPFCCISLRAHACSFSVFVCSLRAFPAFIHLHVSHHANLDRIFTN